MKFAVLLEIDSDDPRVDPTKAMGTAAGVAQLRQAILDRLPHDVTRVIVVMSIEEARLMVEAHAEAVAIVGGTPPVRPPKSY